MKLIGIEREKDLESCSRTVFTLWINHRSSDLFWSAFSKLIFPSKASPLRTEAKTLMWTEHQILDSVSNYRKGLYLICWDYTAGRAITNDILTTDQDIPWYLFLFIFHLLCLLIPIYLNIGHLCSTVNYSNPLPKHRKIVLYFMFIVCSYYFFKKTFIPHIRHSTLWVSQGWWSLIKLTKARDKICREYQ